MSKSDSARQYLSKHPGASVAQITEGLKAEGVEISTALASKIKYGRSEDGATKKRGGRRKGAGRSVAGRSVAGRSVTGRSAAAGSTSKAEAIRQSIRRFGKRFRPRDVIADLAENGIEVSSAQVSTIAKSLGMRPRRKGRGPAAAGVARTTAKRSGEVSLEALVATKRLSDQLGGIENVKSALDALSKIL